MGFVGRYFLPVLVLCLLAVVSPAQQINSTYADLSIPGQWQEARQFASGNLGSEIFYDAATGAMVLVGQRTGLQKVGDIAKFFSTPGAASKDAAAILVAAEYPLPVAYTERASRDIGKGAKPPKLWDLKEGDGNPVWFYVSQLFDEYKVRGSSANSEISEEYFPVHVLKAEQKAVSTGDLLLLEVETDKSAPETAIKKFKMPATFKDQHIRYAWIQFAPGGIASGGGVLTVAVAYAANSGLTLDQLAAQVSAAKVKPL